MATPTPRKVAIESEEETFMLLKSVLSGETDCNEIEVDFTTATWASFHLTLKGERYNSSISTGVMRGLIEFQNSIYRTAAYLQNDRLNGNAISDEIKDALALNFTISASSSDIVAETVKALAEFAGKVTEGMSPRAKVITVLSIVLMFFGSGDLASWIDHQSEIRKEELISHDHDTDMAVIRQMAHDQSENMKILAQARAEVSKLEDVKKSADYARSEILRQSSNADKVTFLDVNLHGTTARGITSTKRRSSSDVIIDGIFKVDAADSTKPEGFSCKVRNVANQSVINITIEEAFTADHDKDIIQQAFWEKREVYLRIRARLLGETYKNATIMAASAVPSSNRQDER